MDAALAACRRDRASARDLCRRRHDLLPRTSDRGPPRFFALSRKRPAVDGGCGGVTAISISPDYFRVYYATLTHPIVAALVRGDGAVLARYPDLPQNLTRLTQRSDLTVQIEER